MNQESISKSVRFRNIGDAIERGKTLMEQGCSGEIALLETATDVLDKAWTEIIIEEWDGDHYDEIQSYLSNIAGYLTAIGCTSNGLMPASLRAFPKVAPSKTLLYLRPLASTRRFLLPDLSGKIAKLLVDPRLATHIDLHLWPLETLLHVCLREAYAGIAFGGPFEFLGMDHGYIVEKQWRATIKQAVNNIDRILFLPDMTDGLKWEMEYIVESNNISKVVLIMLPKPSVFIDGVGDASPSVDHIGKNESVIPNVKDFDGVKDAWGKCAELYHSMGIRIPEYSEKGGLVYLSNSRSKLPMSSFKSILNGTLRDL